MLLRALQGLLQVELPVLGETGRGLLFEVH